jgi:hypothetical protein
MLLYSGITILTVVFFQNSVYAQTQLERINFDKRCLWISDENRAINASGLVYNAPEKGYWEYSAGGNIFKIFRIDFAWRANYLNVPETNRFTIKGSFDLISGSYSAMRFNLFL